MSPVAVAEQSGLVMMDEITRLFGWATMAEMVSIQPRLSVTITL